MSMEKRIIGTFNSEQEVLYAIEELKRQGHRETDMMVVAENRSRIPLVISHTGVMVEADVQVSTLAGVMMDNFITIMTAGMGGGKVNTLSNRLIERGLPVFTAKLCEEEINKGKMILLVDTNGTYDSSVNKAQYETERYETEKTNAVQLREEQLDIIKERVQVGELQLHKEVVEEQRTVHVPLIREEIYVERRPVIDGKVDGSPFTADEIIRIPIMEERIEVTKRPVVVEEVIVGKRKIQETKQVQDIIRKEEARIERSIPSPMEEKKLVTQLAVVEQEEVITESPNILIVEGNPDIASIMNEVKKQETREKRTGSLAVQSEKNKSESSASKNEKASGTLTESPVLKENESESESYVPVSAATVKEEVSHNNENSSLDEENKNNKNQMKKRKNTTQ
ncbi:YsnF/AvaK domain-containing protein [Bacillus sp. AFS031507]|uniref:YsnF/AvaK domain-containing protein n=1 Tax=Bacillus sp. AFS031507 TaxID=2033496 RepID=UPI000BFBB879|nr:YsnF/AvaK domain-containing protein [Bacillus sp. AFS031507]PGY09066.1 stress response protein ysnF [Bacillus sp. AFS031507]